MLPLAILIAGDPIPSAGAARGTYGQMIREAVGAVWPGPWLELHARGELPDFAQFSGLIVSGSAAHVPTREAWIVAVERYLARGVATGLPIFGICFGHQLLGQALGGLVTPNPRGREIGTVSLELLADDPLLTGLPASVPVNMTHIDTVVTLPPAARLLGRTALDENALVYFGERAWGVQFHPEMDGEIIKHYLTARREVMTAEGLDTQAAEAAAADTPASQSILRRFVAHVVLGDGERPVRD